MEKRNVSIFIPYKASGGECLVFLQKRTKDAPRLPDWFGFWGGGIEGNESPEEALRREMKEEMDFVPETFAHFKRYEFDGSIKEVFIAEVGEDFETRITILEGEYGKWFSEQEAADEPKLIEEDKLVLKELYAALLRRQEM